MRGFIVAAVVTGALCALSANAQKLSAQAIAPAGEASNQQNWAFGTHFVDCNYQYDSGTPNNGVGVNNDGEIAWIQTFKADETCNCITSVETMVIDLDSLPGDVTVYIWHDPTPDNDPSDAVLVGQSLPTLVENQDFLTIDLITPVEVAGVDDQFWAGGMIFHEGTTAVPPEFPAPYDTAAPSRGRAWAVFNAAPDPFDPEVLPNNGLFGEVVALGLPSGVWAVRPVSGDPGLCDGCGFEPADMNCDNVVNAEDIEPFICLLFDPNCVPCSSCAGDVNGDGLVNAEDIEPFINILFP